MQFKIIEVISKVKIRYSNGSKPHHRTFNKYLVTLLLLNKLPLNRIDPSKKPSPNSLMKVILLTKMNFLVKKLCGSHSACKIH